MSLSSISARALAAAPLVAIFLPLRAASQCPPLPAGTEPAAHVLTVKGPWRLKAAPALDLEEGCRLPPGAEIVPPERFPSGYAKIAILDRAGALKVRTCNAGEDCAPPIFVPAGAPARPGIWAALLDEVMRKFRSSPTAFVSAITLGHGRLNDAMLQQTASGVDLAPVLSGLDQGAYALEFRRRERNSAAFEPQPAVFNVTWGGSSAVVAVPAPGLYEVRVRGDESGKAWVLIVPAGDRGNAMLAREKEAQTLMNGWPEEANTEATNARRTFYHAFLAQMGDITDGQR